MNIILVEKGEIVDHQVILKGRRAAHIIKILQSKAGDRVRIGIINGGRGTATVLEALVKHPYSVKLALQIEDVQAPEPEIDLILALPRPIMLKRILSQLAALGVGRIYLIHAGRVEKSFWEASILVDGGYQEHLLLGLEQAIDTRIPRVEMHRRFKPFVEDYLPGIRDGYQLCLLAHPAASRGFAEVGITDAGRILLAVGPEGGWLEYEVEMLQRQGFSCCSMGERILKVDTAVIALHAQVSALRNMPGKK